MSKTSNSFLCPECRGFIYCLDSRVSGRENKRQVIKNSQQRLRKYCCIECGRRYVSIEVLNSNPYTVKPMPETIVRKSWRL
jgi:predicted nucleic acid-binding Zn ribbon protein